MIDSTTKVREHYNAAGLTDRIKSALMSSAAEDDKLSVAQLAPLDQFHIRGVQATTELASAAGIEASTRVLDLGCGIGGPARHLAASLGCEVVGIDLSPSFIDAAIYLTERCGLSDRAKFQVADALNLPFEDGTFDAVFLQHVAMNIKDRPALYAEVHRVLSPSGRFGTYDLVLRHGDMTFPVPWARDDSTSFLLNEDDTRIELERAGFTPTLWRDDTELAAKWFKATMTGPPPPNGLSLGLVMGPEFREMATNLAGNLRESRLSLLSAVLKRS